MNEAPPKEGSAGLVRRRGILLQCAALAPFLVFAVAWALSADLRATLAEGGQLLFDQDEEGLQAWARARGIWAPLATSLLMIAQGIAAPIPAVVVTFANSALFGWVWGGILSILSANVAASLCFLLGRAWGEPVVRRLVRDSAWERTKGFVDEHGRNAILVSRLLPFVPFDPISYLAGVSGMRFWPFFLATLIGQIPAGMAYSWLATQRDRPMVFVAAALCVLAGLVLIGWIVRARLRRASARSEAAASEHHTASHEA